MSMYGALPSPPDKRDYPARDYVAKGVRPEIFVQKISPILNQGNVGSCVAHSLATMKWYQENREYKFLGDWSTDYIYHNRLSTDHQGSGMVVREALSQLHKCGVCEKAILPSNTEYPDSTVKSVLPILSGYAAGQKVKSYVRCSDTDELCDCIYQHGAGIVVIEVKSAFNVHFLKDESNWVLPVPASRERSLGYHCVCAVGYNKDGIIVQNSWGEAWGFNGLAVLPWDYPIVEMWSVVDMVKAWDVIELGVDSKDAIVNGKATVLDVPAQIINGRTMVPIRFVAEALGCDVEYIDKDKKVIIRKEK